MTWTYSGDPSDSDVDAVRFLVGDTDTTDQLLTNEEIQYLVDEQGSAHTAAAAAANAIAAKFSRKADESKSVGDLSLSNSYSQRAKSYLDLSTSLQARALAASPPIAVANDYALGAEFYVGQFDAYEE